MNLPRPEVFVFPFPPGVRRAPCGRLLVVAAHPDDECVGAATALLRATPGRAAVVFLTDGAPRDRRWFGAGQTSSRALYRQVRRREALAALGRLGLARQDVMFGEVADQELAWNLPSGMALLRRAVRRYRPRWLLAPAYEGGHPDHDAASFLVSMLLAAHPCPRPEIWEYALYRVVRGVIQSHSVPEGTRSARCLLTTKEARRRRNALACYRSQGETLQWLRQSPERFRQLAPHDYLQPPAGGETVYTLWGMPATAGGLCRSFADFLGRTGALEDPNPPVW